MKIAIIGATGNVGSKLVTEALARGHDVTAIARNTSPLKAAKGLRLEDGDLTQSGSVARLLNGNDVVISSVRFEGLDYESLIKTVKEANLKRLLVVGGAGSLEVAPGVMLVETPEFPAEYKAEASACTEFLKKLRGESTLDWTLLSPSAMFLPEGGIKSQMIFT